MTTRPKPRYTPQEYLDRERRAETKSEYFNGEVFAMSGASRRHNLLVGSLVTGLNNRLRGQRCEVYPSDMRVKVSATGLYTYPDVAVVCEPPELEDDHGDTLLNPTVLIEVLSDSTEAYDRGKKAEHYRAVPSLREYVLVAQDRRHVEVYSRGADGGWVLREFADEDTALLPSIDCQLPLAEIYARLDFDQEARSG